MIWVLLVLALLAGLLAVPLRGEVLWRSASPPRITLRWLFFKVRIFPLPEKLRKRKKKKKKKPPSPAPKPEPQKPKKKIDPSDLGMVIDLLASAKGAMGFLLRHFRFYKIRLDMIVAKENAAATAIAYGKANAMVYGAYTAAKNFLRLETPEIYIRPNFTAGQGDTILEVHGKLTPWAAIGSLIIGIITFIKRSRKAKD